MDQEKSAVSRRGLLRRAGTVAAGAGIGAVAVGAVASPALATDGQPLVQGAVNTGTGATTTIENNSANGATVLLKNSGNVPLVVDPTGVSTVQTPNGGISTDAWGNIYIVGDQQLDIDGNPITQKFEGRITSAFSTSTLPITPERYLVTIPNFQMPSGFDGRAFVVPGSANYDASGRVMPKNNANVPDLTLDFSDWQYEHGFVGVQGTLSIMFATAAGYIALYDTPVWPGHASLNYSPGPVRDGFVQAGFTSAMTVNFKLSAPAVVVFDIVAFIVGNGSGQLNFPAGVAAREGAKGAAAKGQLLPHVKPTLKK